MAKTKAIKMVAVPSKESEQRAKIKKAGKKKSPQVLIGRAVEHITSGAPVRFSPLDVQRVFGDKKVAVERKHAHYFRSVAGLKELDIYRMLELFGVTDQALGHAIKKLIVPGMRGGGKPADKDVQEAIDTLQRWQEMRREDEGRTHA